MSKLSFIEIDNAMPSCGLCNSVWHLSNWDKVSIKILDLRDYATITQGIHLTDTPTRKSPVSPKMANEKVQSLLLSIHLIIP